MIAGAFLARTMAAAGTVLAFSVTLPVWAFLAAGAWLSLDKSSAVRQAVDSAVTELVAGAELEAARAETDALREIAAETQRRLAAANLANALFAERLAESRRTEQELTDEIEDLLAHPVAGDCTVDGDLHRRLRAR